MKGQKTVDKVNINVVEEIAEDYNLDEYDKKIIEKYLELPEDQRLVIKKYLKRYIIHKKLQMCVC